MIDPLLGASLLVLGGGVSWALSRWFAERAARWGYSDAPNPDVITHRRPVPLLGGVAMFVGFIPLLLLLALRDPSARGFLGGVVVVCALGLHKDTVRRHRTPAPVALGQAGIQCAATLLVVLALPGIALWGVVALAIGGGLLINAWNWVDVSDGLAGALGVVSASAAALAGLFLGDPTTTWVAAGLAVVLLAFLHQNRPPARIFMGDVGSFLIGLTMGFLMLRLAGPLRPAYKPAVLALSAVPLLDLAFTLTARTAARLPPWRGDHRHLSLTLLRRGWTPLRLLTVACVASSAALSLVGVVLAVA